MLDLMLVVISAAYLLDYKIVSTYEIQIRVDCNTTFMALNDNHKPSLILTPMCQFCSKQYPMCFVSLGSDLIK